jgi:hypothetical protein
LPDVNVVLQLIHAALHSNVWLWDANEPSAVEQRLGKASSWGARVLPQQTRPAVVPILCHVSPLTVMGKRFTRAATWVSVKEEVRQGALVKHIPVTQHNDLRFRDGS